MLNQAGIFLLIQQWNNFLIKMQLIFHTHKCYLATLLFEPRQCFAYLCLRLIGAHLWLGLIKTFTGNWDTKAPSVGTLLAYLETILWPPVDLHWIFEIFSVTWNFFHSEILSLRISKFHFSSNLSFSFQKLRQLTMISFNKSMFSPWKVFESLICQVV